MSTFAKFDSFSEKSKMCVEKLHLCGQIKGSSNKRISRRLVKKRAWVNTDYLAIRRRVGGSYACAREI